MRRTPLLFALLAVGCLAAAGYLYVADRPPVPLPSFVVEPTEFDLAAVPEGEHDLLIRITNPADRPRQIIGLAEG